MFRFESPQYLWLLLIVPVAILLYALVGYAAKRRLARFGNMATLSELMPDRSTLRLKLKFALWLLAMVLIIFSLARPQLGSRLKEQSAKGIEMMLVVDVSNSMLAEDFEPTRLDRTKYAIGKLFDELNQSRVGLVVFAGEAKVQLPITSDYRMARSFAKRIDPSLLSVQGTDIAQALRLATISFSSDNEKQSSRAIILITDGESHEGDVLAAAEQAKQYGIRIYTIGIGTPEGAPIMIDGNYIKDEDGNMVVSHLDENLLEKVAAITDGVYVRASKQDIGLDEIVREIDSMEKSELEILRYEEFQEYYQYLLAAALALLFVEAAVLDRRNRLLSKFNIFRQ